MITYSVPRRSASSLRGMICVTIATTIIVLSSFVCPTADSFGLQKADLQTELADLLLENRMFRHRNKVLEGANHEQAFKILFLQDLLPNTAPRMFEVSDRMKLVEAHALALARSAT